ncbi:hypothetical protein AV530_006823 [Patagioenas fasciata monilis]|uniref:Uncharacterized protein n=1 Tax=Patagioenas fasciata monilis TaxID=372326 RepID=A0A1V4KQK4_PATFA|nr:hypothetical protein AV530_006823 [Patagioenas fasciata monilis]
MVKPAGKSTYIFIQPSHSITFHHNTRLSSIYDISIQQDGSTVIVPANRAQLPGHRASTQLDSNADPILTWSLRVHSGAQFSCVEFSCTQFCVEFSCTPFCIEFSCAQFCPQFSCTQFCPQFSCTQFFCAHRDPQCQHFVHQLQNDSSHQHRHRSRQLGAQAGPPQVEVTPEPAQSPAKPSPGVVVIICLFVCVLVGAAAVLLVRLCRRRTPGFHHLDEVPMSKVTEGSPITHYGLR